MAQESADAAETLPALAAQLQQHAGFTDVLASLEAGHGGTLGGVWGSSRALVAAALTRSCPATLLVVLPHQADVDSFCDDLELFSDAPAMAFPAWESETRERVLHDEIFGQRLRVLKQLGAGPPPRIVATSIQSLLQPTPSRVDLAGASRQIAVEQTIDPEEFCQWLAERGCTRTTAVELPGEFSLRGGILDVFAPDALLPLRIELFGDEVASIRTFDVATQRSAESLEQAQVTMLSPDARRRAHFSEYLPEGSWVMLAEPTDLVEEGQFYHSRVEHPDELFSPNVALKQLYRFSSVTVAGVPAGSYETTAHMEFESVEQFSGEVGRVRDELDAAAAGQDVYLVCDAEEEGERLREVFAETKLAGEGRLHVVTGRLRAGFRMVAARVVLISAAELFHRQELTRRSGRQTGRAIDSFLELRPGDLIVHLSHGIGRYRGLKLLEKQAGVEEHLELEYHGGTKIYVPASQIDLVQKYVGGRKAKPALAKIGGKSWARQKQLAERAVLDLAAEMLEVEASRAARPGIAFPDDTTWQREFDAAFPYQETPDQLGAIEAIKADMQLAKPMDRLLCGDVGFGKTELAIRAAFKAIDAGYQVAVLVPTTVLAEQHHRTFKARMAEFPFEIAALSRFCTAKEQREIVARAADGSLDLVIGTHRLASPDVKFQNLGLVVIDEEQRFGVAVKQRLKALRASVDVLTMTATPIPRTLHMSLLGVRSISNLETAPKDRLAVETRVARFDETLLRHAVLRELGRDGQLYFVHNRIHDIEAVAQRLKEIVPEARIGIGHGQMAEGALEEIMLGFVRHDFDILLATTIIESGLDIPNANTIFIDDADRYGLADLHQLRGRVGRYKHRAYCYLLIDENRRLSPEAARRMRAIEEFSQMGAGFALAMRDLELRGAGNLLGTQQSGHIAAVGYELYCALLDKAVRQLKQLPPRETVDVAVDLPVPAYFPREYVPDMRTKVDLYRRLARTGDEQALDDLTAELVDRFGSLPPPVVDLLELARLRIWAHQLGIGGIHLEDKYVVLSASDRRPLETLRTLSDGRLRVADMRSAYLPLEAPGDPPAVLAAVKSLLQGASVAS